MLGTGPGAGEELGGVGAAATPRVTKRNVASTRDGRIIADLSPERCVAFRQTGDRAAADPGRPATLPARGRPRSTRDVATARRRDRRASRAIGSCPARGTIRIRPLRMDRGGRHGRRATVGADRDAFGQGRPAARRERRWIQGNAIVMPFGQMKVGAGKSARRSAAGRRAVGRPRSANQRMPGWEA